jgi:hypothetical protein
MKKVFSFSIVLTLTACSTVPESAYESGWNNQVSEATYEECGKTTWNKEMYSSQNLARLVPLGYLTKEQATRASRQDVRIGDPECLVFAAYGLNRGKSFNFTTDTNKNLVEREFSYTCDTSDAKCPGITFKVKNGVVAEISGIPKT